MGNYPLIISPEMRKEIDRAAGTLGMSTADFLRMSARKQLEAMKND